jgi:hypothetical protein
VVGYSLRLEPLPGTESSLDDHDIALILIREVFAGVFPSVAEASPIPHAMP